MSPNSVGAPAESRPALKPHERATAEYYAIGTISRLSKVQRPPAGDVPPYVSVLVETGLPLTANIPATTLHTLRARRGQTLGMHGVLEATFDRFLWTKPRRLVDGRLDHLVESADDRVYLDFSDVRPLVRTVIQGDRGGTAPRSD
jgi:hypothetical protein